MCVRHLGAACKVTPYLLLSRCRVCSLITQFGGLNESIIRRYIKQVLEAVAHLHASGIVHGNISIDHFLVTSTETSLGCIKLSGFLSAWRIRKDAVRTMAYVLCFYVYNAQCR